MCVSLSLVKTPKHRRRHKVYLQFVHVDMMQIFSVSSSKLIVLGSHLSVVQNTSV